MVLKVKKLDPAAVLPAFAHPGDAGLDLCAPQEYFIEPGDRLLIGTGIALEIPEGFVGLVWDRSGLSNNHGLKVLGGVVDSGYRGEVKVGLVNLGREAHRIKKNDKIAQMLIQKAEHPDILEVAELSASSRGGEGFGSTG